MTVFQSVLCAIASIGLLDAAALNQTGWVSLSVDNRDVDAFVPDCATSASPIILSLHAWATDKDQQKKIDQFSNDAYRGHECAVILYAQGLVRGFLFGAVGFSWNAGGCCPSADQNHADDVNFLKKVITKAGTDLGADVGAVFAVGISNGGMMASRLACEDSRVRAVAVISGLVVNGTEGNKNTELFHCPVRTVPLLHFHGLADPIVPFTGCNKTVGNLVCRSLMMLPGGGFSPMQPVPDHIKLWRERNGHSNLDANGGRTSFANRTALCTAYGGSADNVTLCTLAKEGHNWPGDCLTIAGKLPGTTCTADLDATYHTMEFFRRYLPRNVLVV